MSEIVCVTAIVSSVCAVGFGFIGGMIGGSLYQNPSQSFYAGAGVGAALGAIGGLLLAVFAAATATVGLAVAVVAGCAVVLSALWAWFVKFGPQLFTRAATANEIARLRQSLDNSIQDSVARNAVMKLFDRHSKYIRYSNDKRFPGSLMSSLGVLYITQWAYDNYNESQLCSSLIHEMTHLSNTGDNLGSNQINRLGGGKLRSETEADAFAVEIYFEEHYMNKNGFGRDVLLNLSPIMAATYAHPPSPDQIKSRLDNDVKMRQRIYEIFNF